MTDPTLKRAEFVRVARALIRMELEEARVDGYDKAAADCAAEASAHYLAARFFGDRCAR